MSIAPQRSGKQTYWELLKHPNWQRKRLEILDRENFTCEDCGSQSDTLHVHHTYYEKGLKPWEYPDKSLHVLCETCHERAQQNLLELHRQLGRIEVHEVEELLGVAVGLEMQNASSPRRPLLSYQMAIGVARVFGTNADFIIPLAAPDNTISGDDIYEGLLKYWREQK